MGFGQPGGPVVEAISIISLFHEDMLPGTSAEAPMLIPGVSNTVQVATLPNTGRILGFGWNLNLALTGGTLLLRPALGVGGASVPVGPQVAIVPASGAAGFNNLTTVEPFAAGDVIGMNWETDAITPVNQRHLVVTLCIAFYRGRLPV